MFDSKNDITMVIQSTEQKEGKYIQSLFSQSDEIKNTVLDEGALFLNNHPEYVDFTSQEEGKLKIKLDLLLIPILTITILISSADKIILSNASLYGMSKDLNLEHNQYSWTGSIFYFGYLIMEAPANYLLQRYNTGKVLGISFMLWSVIMACMAATHNFAGIAALRFVMGMGEELIFPGVNAIVASSRINNDTFGYTKKTVVNAICFISYCVVNIIGPQFFIKSKEPKQVIDLFLLSWF